MAVILWFIWCARNEAMWNNKAFNANVVVNQATGWLAAWQEAHAKKEKAQSATITGQNQPILGLRCFVDAALFEEVGLAGFGAVVKNSEDLYVAARSGTTVCSLDPYHAEL